MQSTKLILIRKIYYFRDLIPKEAGGKIIVKLFSSRIIYDINAFRISGYIMESAKIVLCTFIMRFYIRSIRRFLEFICHICQHESIKQIYNFITNISELYFICN